MSEEKNSSGQQSIVEYWDMMCLLKLRTVLDSEVCVNTEWYILIL